MDVRDVGIDGEAPLVAALRHGAERALATTPLHPPSYRGQVMYAEVTYALRARLPRPWAPRRYLGVEMVAHPGRSLAIVVVKGDAATGVEHRDPQFEYARGPGGVEVLNADVWPQLTLFPVTTPTPAGEEPELSVWALLHRLVGNRCVAELSLPERVDDGGRAHGWKQRIHLPALELAAAREDAVGL